MNLSNLYMNIPNLGLILYYIVFIVIIPSILFKKSIMLLKYYLPMTLVIAHLFTLVGNKKVIGNLYTLEPNTLISKISTYIINIIALFGILWQIKDYSPKNMLFSGIILLVLVFVISRTVLKDVLDHANNTLEEEYIYNWPLVFVGCVYVLLLIIIQYGMIKISHKFIDEGNNLTKTQQFVKNFDLANINSFNNKLR